MTATPDQCEKRVAAAKADLRALLEQNSEGQIDEIDLRFKIIKVATRHQLPQSILQSAFNAEAKKLKVRNGASPTKADADVPEQKFDPAPNPKTLGEVLHTIVLVLRNQIWCKETEIDAIALWIVRTYGYLGADVFPRLALTSEMRRCGKSTC